MKQPPPDSELGRLFSQFPRAGQVDGYGLRPARDVPMRPVDAAEAAAGKGLHGDRYARMGSGKRGITLIQAEHLPVIAALWGTRKSRLQPCAATWWSRASRWSR